MSIDKPVVLKYKASDGSYYTATFAPHRGMNLMSFKRDKIEAIDQSTRVFFDERSAGLGALIGPHFYHLKDEDVPPEIDESLFPHIAKERAKGNRDVFSHGIARYVPWKDCTVEPNLIRGRLSSIDNYNGVLLSYLEGYNFVMTFEAFLNDDGLNISLGVKSEREGIVGLHYYYASSPDGHVKSVVKNEYNDNGEFKTIPEEWTDGDLNHLKFPLNQEADFGFLPYSPNNNCVILLQNEHYDIKVSSQSPTDEHSWQMWHPVDASFTCIEPLSAKNPRGQIPQEGKLNVKINILPH